jgi:voltage-gated potassium channel Kch
MVMSGTLMWFAEGEVEPNSSATNAFEGLWFAVVTLTSTGSGINVPQTLLGRIIAGATTIVRLALFGVLTSVIRRAMLKAPFGDDGGSDGDLS